MQRSLLPPPEGVLVDDEWGRFVYTPGFADAQQAARWFDELRAVVPWRSERRHMYDRRVDVPRLLAHFPLDDPEPAQGPPLPASLRAAARLVIGRTSVPFSSVGLNLYRDGRDSVAPHNDHLDEIAEGFPIALLSLGATRRMTIRAKPPRRRVLDLDLEAGSLLLMSHATQLHYTHGIPKTAERVGERISLAFRVGRRDAGAERADVDRYR